MTKAKSSGFNFAMFKWVVGGLVLIVFLSLIGIIIMQQDTLVMRKDAEAPLVAAVDMPVKKRPEQPGGMEFPHQERLVFDLLAETQSGDEIASVALPKRAENIAAEVASNSFDQAKLEEIAAQAVLVEPAAGPADSSSAIEPVQEDIVVAAVKMPKSTAPAKAKPEPKKAAATAVKSGNYIVQLASFMVEADAERAQKGYRNKYGALIGNYDAMVKTAQLPNNGGTRYRVQFGSMDIDTARELCSKFKAQGQGCFPLKAN